MRSRLLVWLICGVLVGGILLAILLPRLNKDESDSAASVNYFVSTSGSDAASGLERGKAFKSIQKALELAKPGSTIELADGEYLQSFRSVRNGKPDKPITIKGTQQAVIKGDDSTEGRIIQINHDHLTLDGFQVNGQVGPGQAKEDFRDKLIYVLGTESGKGVEGLKIRNMLLQNAGGECVRLRYFAKNNEINHNTIRYCGIYDFRFEDGGKNGEGIYIGTAPEQRGDGKNPNKRVDESTGNLVHHNTIHTEGNECVDIKEGAHSNIIEYNQCSGQRDPKSAGFDSRGSGNTFRFNTVEDSDGAGFRLGGDTEKDGIDNHVYGNTIRNNASGGIKIQRFPQGKLCENVFLHNEGETVTGEDTGDYDPAAKCD